MATSFSELKNPSSSPEIPVDKVEEITETAQEVTTPERQKEDQAAAELEKDLMQENFTPKAAPQSVATPPAPVITNQKSDDSNQVIEPQTEKEAAQGPINEASTWERVFTFFRKRLKSLTERDAK